MQGYILVMLSYATSSDKVTVWLLTDASIDSHEHPLYLAYL